MKLKISLLLPLVVVVFLAGCAKQETVATAGAIIEKFTPQVSSVASNSPIEFTLIVKNIGDREAKDVKAVLGGLTFLTSSVKQDIEKYWRSENGNIVNDEILLKPLDPSSLLGEDLERGFKGDQGIATWRLTSPIQVRDQTYEPTVNLIYDYSTISTILIKAVGFNYFQSLTESEQKAIDTGVIVSKTTKGPIEVSVKSDQAVISSSSTLPIEIEFTNIGGGILFTGKSNPETSSENLYKNIKAGLHTIQVDLPKDLQCNLTPDKDGRYLVRMVEGKRGRILCHKVIGAVATTQTFSLNINAEYRYLVEGKTAVKVSKTLYQPPIYDLSIRDSSYTIIHEHESDVVRVNFDTKLTNVGNQPINDKSFKELKDEQGNIKYKDGIEVYVTHSVGDYKNDKQPILPKAKELKPFNSAELEWQVEQRPKNNQIIVNIETETKPTFTEDKNTANNQLNPEKTPTILDYNIVIDKLDVTPDKENAIEIVAKVSNKGKNIIGKSIPFTVTVDKSSKNIKCGSSDTNTITIQELRPGDSTKITCIHTYPADKKTLNIIASIPNSRIEPPDKNEELKDVKVGVDVAVGVPEFSVKTISASEFEYSVTATIFNIGAADAEKFQVKFQVSNEQSTEDYKTICINEITKLVSKTSIQVTCTYKIKVEGNKYTLTPSQITDRILQVEISKISRITVIAVITDGDSTNNQNYVTIDHSKPIPVPVISLGTTIISPDDNTWQGTDKITMKVRDENVVVCKLTVQDENLLTANKLARNCGEDVVINLKDKCSSGELCCSVEGEKKCKVTLFSSDETKEFTASRTFNIDRKPPTITSFIVKDRIDANTYTLSSRLATIELTAKDESTSTLRNTASGIKECRFTEGLMVQPKTTFKGENIETEQSKEIKQGNWGLCSAKFLKLVAYTDKNVFEYWKTYKSVDGISGKLLVNIIVEVKDEAGNIGKTSKLMNILAPTEVVSVSNVGSGTQTGYCGELTSENNQIKDPSVSCTFNKVIVDSIGNRGDISLKFTTDKPGTCWAFPTSDTITDSQLEDLMRVYIPICESTSTYPLSLSCKVPVGFPTREIPQPAKYLYITCKDQLGFKSTKLAHAYRVSITLKDILPPLTKIVSVGKTSITYGSQEVELENSKTAKIVVSGDEPMECRWYEGLEKKDYSDDYKSCDGKGTSSATCNTYTSKDNENFVRIQQGGGEYSMCVTCKDSSEDNKQSSVETQCVTFKVKDFP